MEVAMVGAAAQALLLMIEPMRLVYLFVGVIGVASSLARQLCLRQLPGRGRRHPVASRQRD